MAVSVGASSLVGIILESVHYGMFVILFIYSMHLQLCMFKKGSAKRPNLLIILILIILFSLSTAHWCINVAKLYEAVITIGQDSVSLDVYFANLREAKQLAETAIFSIGFWLGDAVLIYRLYHIYYPRWWICVVPSLTWVMTAVSVVAKSLADVSVGPKAFVRQIEMWALMTFVFVLATNAYCSSLIIFRLWTTYRNPGRVGASYLSHVLIIFMESAAILVIFHLATNIAYILGSNIHYALVDASTPIAGIAFSLVLVQLNRSRSTVETDNGTGIRSLKFAIHKTTMDVSRGADVDLEMSDPDMTPRKRGFSEEQTTES